MSIYQPDLVDSKTRIAVFGSFYRGLSVLNDLLTGTLSGKVMVVGVATDDPGQPFVSAHKRVWQYPHTDAERHMVAARAQSAGVDVYTGSVKSEYFRSLVQDTWQPDICIMATFGQKIPKNVYAIPHRGFYNLHPCIDDAWPSHYAGCNPFKELLLDKQPYTQIAMHEVDDGFDTGKLIAYSDKVIIPPGVGVIDLHKLTAPVAARLACREIENMIRTRKAHRAEVITCIA